MKVVDGDTVHILEGERRTYKVRIGAIDAPERKQAFSVQSRNSLAELVAGRTVLVRWHKTDQYRRIVGSVFANDVDVGLMQVRRGFAWHFKRFEKEQEASDRRLYADAEKDARAAALGLWRDSTPISPWDWRARPHKR